MGNMTDDWRRCDWVEYPPREQKLWRVTAFDANGHAALMAERCSHAEAQDLADKWIARPDIIGVKGVEYDA